MNKLEIVSSIFDPRLFTPYLKVEGNKEYLIAKVKAEYYCRIYSFSIERWQEKCSEHGYYLAVDFINKQIVLEPKNNL